jgi:alpha-tubulin suppressor-like RCC1 family protein
VQCWGLNTIKGHLGNGTTVNSAIPVTVTGITNAIALSVGFGNACAALSTGAVQCWGAVGVSPERVALIPETVAGVSGAVTIATNGSTACAVTASGSIQCWGNNVYGQFGNGTSLTLSEAPVAVSGITNAVSVTAGFLNICARLSTGSVQCWGYNNTGQLGNGTLTQSNVPVTVTGY